MTPVARLFGRGRGTAFPGREGLVGLVQTHTEFNGNRAAIGSRKREQKPPEFLALNPNGKVPVLVDSEGPLLSRGIVFVEHLVDEGNESPRFRAYAPPGWEDGP